MFIWCERKFLNFKNVMYACKTKPSYSFYLKRKKVNKAGKIPVYLRVTIDGLKDEISLGFTLLSDDWRNDAKMVKSSDSRYKVLNKKISQAKTDIERHFDLIQAPMIIL